MDCQTTENKKQRGFAQIMVRGVEMLLVVVLSRVNIHQLCLNTVNLSQVCASEREEHAAHPPTGSKKGKDSDAESRTIKEGRHELTSPSYYCRKNEIHMTYELWLSLPC